MPPKRCWCSPVLHRSALDERVRVTLQDDGLEQLNGLLTQLDGADWFYLLRAGDRLDELALLLLAERMVEVPTRCVSTAMKAACAMTCRSSRSSSPISIWT